MCVIARYTSLAIVVCFVLRLHEANVTNKYTLRRDGAKIYDSQVWVNVTCSSLVECLVNCNQLDLCWSLSFSSSQQRCLIGKNDVTHLVHTRLVLEANWVTLSKRVFTVFITGTPLDTKVASLAEAVAVCDELQTTVASPADLLASRTLGLDRCYCGWLSDGSKGLVLQTETDTCSNLEFTIGIINCSSYVKGHVWCRM